MAGNCSAFPEHLLESELFGHLRGAFIGASMAKPGKFELATGSAILFDEIGEMPLALQPKLLRVLQEQMRTVPCIVSESQLSEALESLRPLAVAPAAVFERPSEPVEMARTTRNYASQLGAKNVRLARSGKFVWIRMQTGEECKDILFQSNGETR